jgi:hypothetical protein
MIIGSRQAIQTLASALLVAVGNLPDHEDVAWPRLLGAIDDGASCSPGLSVSFHLETVRGDQPRPKSPEAIRVLGRSLLVFFALVGGFKTLAWILEGIKELSSAVMR